MLTFVIYLCAVLLGIFLGLLTLEVFSWMVRLIIRGSVAFLTYGLPREYVTSVGFDDAREDALDITHFLSQGTSSVLRGAHCFFLHPFFVARAWWHLYGFPWDPRLWVCFFVHDVGYIGKNRMDDADGERHPELGASIVGWLFGKSWGDFCLLHSRHYAKRFGQSPSRLCFVDKLAFCYTPAWLYFLCVDRRELREYLSNSSGYTHATRYAWHQHVCDHSRNWVAQHKDGAPDLVTPIRHKENLECL